MREFRVRREASAPRRNGTLFLEQTCAAQSFGGVGILRLDIGREFGAVHVFRRLSGFLHVRDVVGVLADFAEDITQIG